MRFQALQTILLLLPAYLVAAAPSGMADSRQLMARDMPVDATVSTLPT